MEDLETQADWIKDSIQHAYEKCIELGLEPIIEPGFKRRNDIIGFSFWIDFADDYCLMGHCNLKEDLKTEWEYNAIHDKPEFNFNKMNLAKSTDIVEMIQLIKNKLARTFIC